MKLDKDPTNTDLQAKERNRIQSLKKWNLVLEKILKQKARCDWIQLGDSNSHFFFASAKQRCARNGIYAIYSEQDVLLTDINDIKEEVSSFIKGSWDLSHQSCRLWM